MDDGAAGDSIGHGTGLVAELQEYEVDDDAEPKSDEPVDLLEDLAYEHPAPAEARPVGLDGYQPEDLLARCLPSCQDDEPPRRRTRTRRTSTSRTAPRSRRPQVRAAARRIGVAAPSLRYRSRCGGSSPSDTPPSLTAIGSAPRVQQFCRVLFREGVGGGAGVTVQPVPGSVGPLGGCSTWLYSWRR